MLLTTVVPGAIKPEPFTVLILKNPALEAPWMSNTYVADPISPAEFAAAVTYISDGIFGRLPGQAEALLGDPLISPSVRLLTLDLALPAAEAAVDQYALAAQDGASFLLVPRRSQIAGLLALNSIVADVVFVVSSSPSHSRASAWFTGDDDSSPGDPFTLSGASFFHRYRYLVPGTIAIHSSATGPTAAHEFSHAISSYTNGKLVDLYIESTVRGVNSNWRYGNPTPSVPAMYETYTMNGVTTQYTSDPHRHPLGYGIWRTYHCEKHNPAEPALMDNYHAATNGLPLSCASDHITRRFIRDRILAKMKR